MVKIIKLFEDGTIDYYEAENEDSFNRINEVRVNDIDVSKAIEWQIKHALKNSKVENVDFKRQEFSFDRQLVKFGNTGNLLLKYVYQENEKIDEIIQEFESKK
ncbi:hypothetical protein SAMN04487895_101663 [Paenibacillus sophorae]|uniref:Uncharacterized protein n=1 Tax=Paenibacillus sophorae TaxID=1333845 RepID=A0A1H8GW83_9BACL|nr:hypothetical protein [Paenibacillus sophorae]QWU14360.1 hypothetical protein KP014_20860 [Paenibacillus sophorae]SEN48125.1 hypothetical protein SAMN04487895_101663 [Paenibacillus sophorae]